MAIAEEIGRLLGNEITPWSASLSKVPSECILIPKD
jgi:hypothetical protein